MSGTIIRFERVGRTREIEHECPDVDPTDVDAVAEAAWRAARRHLSSRMFMVAVDPQSRTGSIEAGRFGRFSFEAMP